MDTCLYEKIENVVLSIETEGLDWINGYQKGDYEDAIRRCWKSEYAEEVIDGLGRYPWLKEKILDAFNYDFNMWCKHCREENYPTKGSRLSKLKENLIGVIV